MSDPAAQPGGRAAQAACGEEGVLTPTARAELDQFRRDHHTQVLTIIFSDLVGSTKLQTDLGNLRAAELVQQHYATVRRVLAGCEGREIKTAGDSMLIAFASPSAAVRFALYAQRAVRRAAEQEPALPPVRVGVHQGQVVLETRGAAADVIDVYGLQVSTAARIMDLAAGGQVLVSRAVFDDARAILRAGDFEGFAPLTWRNHGPYRFKGVADAHEVCEVGETGLAPLAPPPAGAKGWPAEDSPEELGWRPAAGVTVPESSWTLTEKLGEGEFGEVWKAYNPADHSHQAFKFCFRRDRLPALKREARLLKRLRQYRHPSLVEVYDVTAGERPPFYLEMEYVEGPSLAAWLGTNPPLAERLEVIAQVADALDTVHAAGIFHRDIKPANILLTARADGRLQAKLTDFGLGAAGDDDLLKSIAVSRVEGLSGTWDYLAPELRRGEPPSAQSDLYSLGLTLFQVAVGDLQTPLTGDWEARLPDPVLREDVRRCVVQDPAGRWPRAADLAAALRGHDTRLRALHLEHDRQEHRRRAARLRRIAGVALAVALVAATLGGVAVYQGREAARQRDRALAQKRLAMDAVTRLTHDVPRQLRDVPGTLPALKAMLEDNVALLDRILALEPDTDAARRERAVNLVTVGDRWLLLGEPARAATAFQEGHAISRALVVAHPNEPVYRHDTSNALDRLGDVALVQGRTADALAAYEEAMALTRELAGPGGPATRHDLWMGLDKLGRVYLRLGRTGDAAKVYGEAMALAAGQVRQSPDDPQALRDLSMSHERLAGLQLAQGRVREALASYEAGMDLARRYAATKPDSAEAQRDLSVGYDELGVTYLRLGRTEDALKAHAEALRIARALLAREPDNARYRRDVSIALERRAEVDQALGRSKEALAALDEALTLARQAAAPDPGNAAAALDVAGALSKLGNARLAAGQRPEARTAYAEALAIATRLAAADPGDAQAARAVSVFHNKVGGVHLALGQAGDAAKSFEASAAVAGRLAGADPSSAQAQRDWGVSSHRAMAAYAVLGDLPRWREAARRALAQFERACELSGDDPGAKRDVAAVLSDACTTLPALPGATAEDRQTALGWARRLVEVTGGRDPGALEALATCQALTGDRAGAEASLRKAIEAAPQGAEGEAARKRMTARLEELRSGKAPRAEEEPPRPSSR